MQYAVRAKSRYLWDLGTSDVVRTTSFQAPGLGSCIESKRMVETSRAVAIVVLYHLKKLSS